ncbi:MAG: aspartate ammonia-lyase [Candidatus Desulfovibrio kirbyi]|uniref:Aspartate ammonia-lyase n=1 Tax=Candidatus Desulfovibrio kirbyi TaxID=2696086 RepID=A0A6L2R6C9_9BACT|nr:MAG: aspartate ammonia-lyase [Candidatus Desulfovibrio kirbyi]
MTQREKPIEYRIEHDFIGEREVPAGAYYGVQSLRGKENFPITGDRIQPSLIRAIAMVKKAAAIANRDVGLLEPALCKAIVAACDEIIADKHHDEFIVDPIQGGAGTSFNMNANEVIANRALEILGKPLGRYDILSPNTVDMGQSANDAFPTAIHVAVLADLDSLIAEMRRMHDSFVGNARKFHGMIKMGRTHLQDAVPIRLGQEFEAYARVIKRDINRINGSGQHLYVINLGATAVGTGLNADPEYIKLAVKYLSEISGYCMVNAEHLVDATQNTDAYTEVSASLKVCMMNMSKIANDIRMMASGPRCGLAELNLPPRQPGSSIMPGKVNPVMAEVVNQVAFQVIGNDNTICLASEAGQFELNVMEPVLVHNLLQSIRIMRNAFRVFREFLLEGLTSNEKRMSDYVENSVGIITAVSPHIGYEAAAAIAKEAITTGKPVRELLIRENLLTKEDLDSILHPLEMTQPGIAGYALLKARKKADKGAGKTAQKTKNSGK